MLKQAEAIKASSTNHDAESAATALSLIAAGSPSVEPVVSGLRDSLKSPNSPSKAAVILRTQALRPQGRRGDSRYPGLAARSPTAPFATPPRTPFRR